MNTTEQKKTSIEAPENPTPKNKGETVVVQMQDGRELFFNTNRPVQRTASVAETAATIHLDFINGEVENITFHQGVPTYNALAALGLVTYFAGMNTPADVKKAFEALKKGPEAVILPKADPLAGASLLTRAVMEAKGKQRSTVEAFLAGKSRQELHAIRTSASVAPIYKRLQAEQGVRAPKEKQVEGDPLEGLE